MNHSPTSSPPTFAVAISFIVVAALVLLLSSFVVQMVWNHGLFAAKIVPEEISLMTSFWIAVGLGLLKVKAS